MGVYAACGFGRFRAGILAGEPSWPAVQFRAARKWWRDSLRIIGYKAHWNRFRPRLNTLCANLLFENLTNPRRSEPGAIMTRGADLPESASAPASARKLWRVGLVPRPTLRLRKGREWPHMLWQQLIIFLTLHLNSCKRMPGTQPSYTVHMAMLPKKWPGNG